MPDKTIGQLPSVSAVSDASLIPLEQSGVASKMTGLQFKNWAIAGALPYATAAAASATSASDSAEDAADSAEAADNSAVSAAASAAAAEAERNKIENMGVTSTTLDAGSTATVSKSYSQGVVTLNFGIPRGNPGIQGSTGPRGAQGVQGPKGDTGTAVAVETSGMYYFNVDNDSTSPTYGHLLLTYTGDTEPDIEIDYDTTSPTYGHLLWNV